MKLNFLIFAMVLAAMGPARDGPVPDMDAETRQAAQPRSPEELAQPTAPTRDRPDLVEYAAEAGAFLLEGLQDLQAKYPDKISNARGRGLMCAFDLATPEMRNTLQQMLYEEYMIILGCGEKSIRYRPHLNVSREELQMSLNLIEKCLNKMGS